MSEIEPVSEEIRRAEQGIARMKKLDREIFMSVRFDDLRYEEAARLHGVTVSRVEKAITRALRVIGRARRNEPPPSTASAQTSPSRISPPNAPAFIRTAPPTEPGIPVMNSSPP